jgi:hypothetical protein
MRADLSFLLKFLLFYDDISNATNQISGQKKDQMAGFWDDSGENLGSFKTLFFF